MTSFPAFGVGGSPTGPFSQPVTQPWVDEQLARPGQRAAEEAAAKQEQAQDQLMNTASHVGAGMADFMRRMNEQEAITYRQDLRNQMMTAGQKAVNAWEPTVYGPDALSAPSKLNQDLIQIKGDLLKTAPSEMAKTEAGKELDHMIAQYGVHAENVATKGFKKWGRDVQDQWEGQLLQVMANGGADPGIHQWVVDTGKESWDAHGRTGIIFSPEEAEMGKDAFLKKAAITAFKSQLYNPRFSQKAIADWESGFYSDKLDADQIIQGNHLVDQQKEHLARMAEHYQAVAERNQHKLQDENANSYYELFLRDPDKFREVSTDAALADMIAGKRLTRGAAASIISIRDQRSVPQSDPAALDALYRAAADGTLTEDLYTANRDKLNGHDQLAFRERVTRKDADAQGLFKVVEGMFRGFNIEAEMKTDAGFKMRMDQLKVGARAFVDQSLRQGIPADQIEAQMRLKFDPLFGEDATPAPNRYFSYIPDDPAQVTEAFRKLYQEDAGGMDKATWDHNARVLKGLLPLAKEKQSQLARLRGK